MICNCKLAESKSPEMLVSALFFMMTRYAAGQDKSLVKPIVDHFDWLSKHPDLVNTNLQQTCSRLQKNWLLQSQPVSMHGSKTTNRHLH